MRRTARGDELIAVSADVFETLHARWIGTLGADRVLALEQDLGAMAAAAGGKGLADLAGWLR